MPENNLPVRVTRVSFYPLIPAAAAVLAAIAAGLCLAGASVGLRWLGVAAAIVIAVALVEWLRRFLRR